MSNSYPTTSLLTILTPLLLFLVMFLMGGGHGYYEPAIILFPTGLISFSLFDEIVIPFMILAVIQYPVYGLLIDKSNNKRKTLLYIIGFHVGLTLITFFTVKEYL
jgi:hypothetical protein